MKENYISYNNALTVLNLQVLAERRKMLCERFATNCMKYPKSKDMFPLNPSSDLYLRQTEKYKVDFARKGRLLNSAIPQMQRLLNKK